MADKSIGELVSATSVGATDLFVLEQNNTAKKLTFFSKDKLKRHEPGYRYIYDNLC